MKNSYLAISVGFAVLFILYHAAEYMIVYQNNVLGFFGFQLLFFISANTIARLQGRKDLGGWGLRLRPFPAKPILKGILAGFSLYGVAWVVNLLTGSERVTGVLPLYSFVATALPFIFGVLFSSLSEDILTRAYIYFHFEKRLPNWALILFSASVFVMNHIYKLGKGPEAWLYLPLLGILLVIPLLASKQLWFTTAMHWAGNVFFYISHNSIKTVSVPGGTSANYIFCLVIVLFIGASIRYCCVAGKTLEDAAAGAAASTIPSEIAND